MQRRRFFGMAAIGASVMALNRFTQAAPQAPLTSAAVDDMRRNWKSFLPKEPAPSLSLSPVEKPQNEWRQLLGQPAFNVLRHEGTERPFSSPLNDEKRAGLFVCAGCALPVFTSQMKFDSGTGWPSFFTSIPGHFATSQDVKMILPRTEYHCVRCGGHHGHVFDDGPLPTRERWCNNGVSLKFIPASHKA